MRILVIEDDKEAADFLTKGLRESGYAVDHAADGEEALQKVVMRPPTIVLSDMVMPRMGGLDLLKSIRADPEISETRFIMVTGHNEPHSVIAAKKAGVNGYIIKPFNVVALKQRLEAVLGPIPPAPGPMSALGTA